MSKVRERKGECESEGVLGGDESLPAGAAAPKGEAVKKIEEREEREER